MWADVVCYLSIFQYPFMNVPLLRLNRPLKYCTCSLLYFLMFNNMVWFSKTHLIFCCVNHHALWLPPKSFWYQYISHSWNTVRKLWENVSYLHIVLLLWKWSELLKSKIVLCLVQYFMINEMNSEERSNPVTFHNTQLFILSEKASYYSYFTCAMWLRIMVFN